MSTLTKKNLLLIGHPQQLPAETWAAFCSRYNIIHYNFPTHEDFYKSLANGICHNIDGILHISFNTPADNEPVRQGWTARALPHFPPTLKVIVKFGHGYESEDIEGLKAKNISFYNSTGGSYSTALIGLYLIISVFRRLSHYERMARDGVVVAAMRESAQSAEDPCGKRVGIIGMGAIGQELASQLVAIGMRVHCLGRKSLLLSPELNKVVTTHDSLESICAEVDCIVLACSYSPSSHHLLNKDVFAKMKRGMRLVNIARGKCIDENALLAALADGTVEGAGLDVFENE